MRHFEYYRPKSLDEACALLAEDEEALLLAGGQTLLPTIKQGLNQPSGLVDLGAISSLRDIRHQDERLIIGAMARHTDVAQHKIIRRLIPGLADLAAGIGDPQIRNRGTMGGSVINNDPAADYPAAILACACLLHTNQRVIPADDFYLGLFTTAIEPGEILTEISFRIPQQFNYASIRHQASRFAVAGVAIARFEGDETRVAVTGAGAEGVYRWEEAEEALQKTFDIDMLTELQTHPSSMLSDPRVPQSYRARLVDTLTRRAVFQASGR